MEGLANGCTNVIKIEMEKGSYDFISFESYGFKYIKFVCTKGEVEVRNVKVRNTSAPCLLRTWKRLLDKEICRMKNLKVLEARNKISNRMRLTYSWTAHKGKGRAGCSDSFYEELKSPYGRQSIEYNFLRTSFAREI